MSDEDHKQFDIRFEDATAGIPAGDPSIPQGVPMDVTPEDRVRERVEAFGRDLQSVIERHNGDHHFAATDADILAEYILSQIAVFKFASQSRDYRLFNRMSKAAAGGKIFKPL